MAFLADVKTRNPVRASEASVVLPPAALQRRELARGNRRGRCRKRRHTAAV
jgi:hypothetical protein